MPGATMTALAVSRRPSVRYTTCWSPWHSRPTAGWENTMCAPNIQACSQARRGELPPVAAWREAGVVPAPRAVPRRPPGARPLHPHGPRPFRGRVARGGQPGRPRPDHGHVAVLEVTDDAPAHGGDDLGTGGLDH